jgi:hypothetical protein
VVEALISIVKKIIIYTDGSLIGEKGGFAFLYFLPGDSTCETTRFFPKQVGQH